jgi:SAM-dependent methyltransferase
VRQIQARADELAAEGVFLGGPARDFESLGRLQFTTLLENGLWPDSKVLDVGCGALRAGYWLLHFLEPGCYFGLEPNREMVELGMREFLEPGLVEQARPSFAHNADFDFGVFGTRFEFFLARSIWTHASKQHIRVMLDSCAATAAPNAVMLASYFRTPRIPRGEKREHRGTEWVGRSHTRGQRGRAYHSHEWIASECQHRGLRVSELEQRPVNEQRWLRIDFA